MKFYMGRKAPAHYSFLVQIRASGGVWNIYTFNDPKSRFVSVKVAASYKVPHKANYWLTFQSGQLAGYDLPTLEKYRADLLERVVDALNAGPRPDRSASVTMAG